MRTLKLIAILAVAAPAFAQVGPNPAVQGSLDPTVGRTGDPVTAPDDSIRGGPEGSVVDSAAPAEPADESTTNASDAATASKRSTAPTSESAHKPR